MKSRTHLDNGHRPALSPTPATPCRLSRFLLGLVWVLVDGDGVGECFG